MRSLKVFAFGLVTIFLLASLLPAQTEQDKQTNSKSSNIRHVNPPTLSTPTTRGASLTASHIPCLGA